MKALLPVLLALPVLAACATAPSQVATPTEQWTDKVLVEATPDQVRLALHSNGLSPNQAQALVALADRWRATGAGEVLIEAPRGGSDEASHAMMAAAHNFLRAQGVPGERIRIAGYDAGGAPNAPLVVGFSRYQAVVPQCGQNWENLSRTMQNAAFQNFGCAVTANMAAQLANPEDLLRPRAMTPADAQRRETVMGLYRAGEVTSSDVNPQASISISQTVD